MFSFFIGIKLWHFIFLKTLFSNYSYGGILYLVTDNGLLWNLYISWFILLFFKLLRNRRTSIKFGMNFPHNTKYIRSSLKIPILELWYIHDFRCRMDIIVTNSCKYNNIWLLAWEIIGAINTNVKRCLGHREHQRYTIGCYLIVFLLLNTILVELE